MEKRKRNGKKIISVASLAILFSQTMGAAASGTEQLEYAGTTQSETASYYLAADSLAVELEVAEVYARSGSQISQGDQILKLTEDSYQNALDYYAAAIIRADSHLTDVRLEYDQGTLEARYAYETARARADQAEFIKEFQQKELEDTITEHEEVLEEIDERIAELEEGIAAGSYETGSSSSGSTGGASSGSGSSSQGSRQSGSGEQESETGQPGSGAGNTEDQTENPGGQPGTETEGTGGRPGTGTEGSGNQTGTSGNPAGNMEQEISELKTRLEEKNEEYQEILSQIEALGICLSGAGETENRAQDSTQNSTQNTKDSTGEENPGSQLQEAIDGDTNVKTNLENVQKNLASVPEDVMDVVQKFYPDYKDYILLLENCIIQLNTDITIQETVKAALNGQENGSSTGIDGELLEPLLSRLNQVGTEKSELYEQLVSLQEEWINLLQAEQETGQSEADQNRETESDQSETNQNQESESGQSEAEQESGSGQSGTDQNQEPETGQSEENRDSETNGESETGRQPESGELPGSGEGNQNPASGSNSSGGGGSMPSGSANASGFSGTPGTSESVSSESGQTGNMGLSLNEISLFGNTYDLTQVQNLLEREVSDSDAAQELLEELKEKRQTVEEQYNELIREQKITELGIQYTCDTSIISGKLAEFTYQEEMKDWEAQLTEAETEKSELEAQKAFLDSMEDGILTADRDGIVAEVSCEEGDIIRGSDPIISYYDMDTVTISIQVPQEEIAGLSVGDTVDVTINGMLKLQGTIEEKLAEPVSGTSRTAVDYEVKIGVDNPDGRLSAGLSASVTVSQEEAETEQESGNE